MKLTVHHLEYSRSTRLIWLFEELGVDYELKRYARTKGWRAPDDLARLHPIGRSPLLEVDGRVLAESGAILDWVVFDSGIAGAADWGPQGEGERQDYRFFLHAAEGSVMPPLVMRLILRKARQAPVPFFIKPILKSITTKIEAAYPDGEIDRWFSFLDQRLSEREWFLGDRPTAVDVQMSFPLVAGLQRGAGDRPHVKAWLERVQARPAWQRAIEKGGPLAP